MTRKLTIGGHRVPCMMCGRNAKHIYPYWTARGVYCDRCLIIYEYEQAQEFRRRCAELRGKVLDSYKEDIGLSFGELLEKKMAAKEEERCG